MPIILKVLSLLLMFSACTNYFLLPDRFHYSDPRNESHLEYEDIYFASLENLKLHAQLIKDKSARKGLMVFFHGNAENLSSHYLNFSWIPPEGYDYLIVDWRGYGRSWGEAQVEGAISDSIKALELAWELKEKRGYKKFIVYGQSMGGAIVAKALSAFKMTEKINLLVLDSTFYDYKKIAFDALSGHFMTFLFSPLSYVLVTNEYSPENELKHLSIPILVVHGTSDQTIPFKHGKDVFGQLGTAKKWFWEIEGGNHIDIFMRHDGKYRKQFLELLETI
ncbi:MAG: hypothetical protein A2181_00295 [Bdellovibrionales bacterium RIFOXYA1_FULL_38_20]|nr:MAG: hypothetical protein A2181_00295 [Bdellovibrionales bacterium RIFOXYA1_FULL_38_20]